MDERDIERITQLGLVADKGLEWKVKCEALTAERDRLAEEVDRLRADLTQSILRCHAATTERDRLAAELAAAKALSERYLAVWNTTEQERQTLVSKCALLELEKGKATARADAAEAHVADLRVALEELKAEYEDPAVRDDARKVTYMWSLSIIRAALTRTPAQSLGRCKAAALRAAEDAIAKRTEEQPGRFGGYTVDDARRDLLIAADRLEASHD